MYLIYKYSYLIREGYPDKDEGRKTRVPKVNLWIHLMSGYPVAMLP